MLGESCCGRSQNGALHLEEKMLEIPNAYQLIEVLLLARISVRTRAFSVEERTKKFLFARYLSPAFTSIDIVASSITTNEVPSKALAIQPCNLDPAHIDLMTCFGLLCKPS